MLFKRWIFHDPDEIEIRLSFYRSFSTFWNIFGLWIQVYWGVRGDLKSSVSQNQTSYNHIPNIKPEIFKT